MSIPAKSERVFNLLDVPIVGAFLRKRYSRMILQGIVFAVALVMILHGFFGPQLAPRNLSTLLTWVHYRGILVFVLLAAGNFFCMACPFMLPRELARKFSRPVRNWPRALRNKWFSISLFVFVLYAYELFDLWGSPWWTAWLIVAFFAAALLVDVFFKNASFCKYVCPIGQFNFISSTVSPLEVKVDNPEICSGCKTLDCIRGTRHPENNNRIVQRGCELALFQPNKTGNLDCTFCLDCVYACPHDNVAITTRLPGSELWDFSRRSGIGRIASRSDMSVLALIFTFGALLNAFGMVSPVYAFQDWLSGILNTQSEMAVLGTLFFLMLVVEPALLLGAASFSVKRLTGSGESIFSIIKTFAYSLIPFGFGMWVAHYSFHLLTGLWTFLPVVQGMMIDAGFTLFGEPRWQLSGLPDNLVLPLEYGFLSLGLLGTLLVAYRLSEKNFYDKKWQAFIPWAILSLLLFIAAIWLLQQPMEMRGTFLGG